MAPMLNGLAGTQFRNAEKVRKWVDDSITPQLITFFRYGLATLSEILEKVYENDEKHFD